jgi:mycofactocin precursor
VLRYTEAGSFAADPTRPGRCCRLALGVTNVRAIPAPARSAPEVRMPETPQTDAPVLEAPAAAEEELVEESLVEEVSIDGMCGVY